MSQSQCDSNSDWFQQSGDDSQYIHGESVLSQKAERREWVQDGNRHPHLPDLSISDNVSNAQTSLAYIEEENLHFEDAADGIMGDMESTISRYRESVRRLLRRSLEEGTESIAESRLQPPSEEHDFDCLQRGFRVEEHQMDETLQDYRFALAKEQERWQNSFMSLHIAEENELSYVVNTTRRLWDECGMAMAETLKERRNAESLAWTDGHRGLKPLEKPEEGEARVEKEKQLWREKVRDSQIAHYRTSWRTSQERVLKPVVRELRQERKDSFEIMSQLIGNFQPVGSKVIKELEKVTKQFEEDLAVIKKSFCAALRSLMDTKLVCLRKRVAELDQIFRNDILVAREMEAQDAVKHEQQFRRMQILLLKHRCDYIRDAKTRARQYMDRRKNLPKDFDWRNIDSGGGRDSGRWEDTLTGIDGTREKKATGAEGASVEGGIKGVATTSTADGTDDPNAKAVTSADSADLPNVQLDRKARGSLSSGLKRMDSDGQESDSGDSAVQAHLLPNCPMCGNTYIASTVTTCRKCGFGKRIKAVEAREQVEKVRFPRFVLSRINEKFRFEDALVSVTKQMEGIIATDEVVTSFWDYLQELGEVPALIVTEGEAQLTTSHEDIEATIAAREEAEAAEAEEAKKAGKGKPGKSLFAGGSSPHDVPNGKRKSLTEVADPATNQPDKDKAAPPGQERRRSLTTPRGSARG